MLRGRQDYGLARTVRCEAPAGLFIFFGSALRRAGVSAAKLSIWAKDIGSGSRPGRALTGLQMLAEVTALPSLSVCGSASALRPRARRGPWSFLRGVLGNRTLHRRARGHESEFPPAIFCSAPTGSVLVVAEVDAFWKPLLWRESKPAEMIQAIMVFNNHGKPRLVRFYQRFVSAAQLRYVPSGRPHPLPSLRPRRRTRVQPADHLGLLHRA